MRDEPPEEGSVHKATVKRIEAYGVFVQLDGFRKHGLVHSSQVSNYLSFTRDDTDEEKKAELAGIVAVGDVVWVKVVEVGWPPSVLSILGAAVQEMTFCCFGTRPSPRRLV